MIDLPTRRLFLFRDMAGAAAIACTTRSFSALAEANTPACVLTHEQEIGPYYLDLEKVRQDITEGKPGVPLRLRVTIVDATRCSPIGNAALDIWHCDAMGVYSGFTAAGSGGPMGGPPGGPIGPRPGPPSDFGGSRPVGPPPGFGNRKHDNTTFLRGVQLTDANGIVEFSTIYPGWYMGRGIHIHMRVHVGGDVQKAKYEGGHVSYTGQLFFPEDITDAVAKLEPYAKHDLERTRQDEDHVFLDEHGSGSIVSLTRINPRSLEDGFTATAVISVDPNATSREVGPA